MSLFDVLSAGRSGLSAASTGLSTTTHNVTNATTEGFTRRSVSLVTADPIRRGPHWLGQGVDIASIGRSADALSLARLLTASGEAASASTAHAALSSAEQVFEPSAGQSLRSSIDGIFDAFGAATADPGDLGQRREVTAALSRFTSSVSGMASSLSQGIAERDERIAASIDQVNADLREVASLNEQIARAGGPLSAGDLADQRDAVLVRLSDSVGATASFERDGSATVRIAGHSAASGGSARTLSLRFDSGGSPVVALSVDGGSIAVTGELGGAVSGELSAREGADPEVTAGDRLCTTISDARERARSVAKRVDRLRERAALHLRRADRHARERLRAPVRGEPREAQGLLFEVDREREVEARCGDPAERAEHVPLEASVPDDPREIERYREVLVGRFELTNVREEATHPRVQQRGGKAARGGDEQRGFVVGGRLSGLREQAAEVPKLGAELQDQLGIVPCERQRLLEIFAREREQGEARAGRASREQGASEQRRVLGSCERDRCR